MINAVFLLSGERTLFSHALLVWNQSFTLPNPLKHCKASVYRVLLHTLPRHRLQVIAVGTTVYGSTKMATAKVNAQNQGIVTPNYLRLAQILHQSGIPPGNQFPGL